MHLFIPNSWTTLDEVLKIIKTLLYTIIFKNKSLKNFFFVTSDQDGFLHYERKSKAPL